MGDRHPRNPEAAKGATSWRGLIEAALSLQCKATVLVVVVTLSVTAAVSGYLLHASYRISRNQHNEQVIQLATVLAEAARPAYLNGDSAALEALAERVAGGVPLGHVIFHDVDGNELTASQHPSGNALQAHRQNAARKMIPGRPTYHRGFDEGAGCLDVTFPINARAGNQDAGDGKDMMLLGYVSVGMLADGWRRSMLSKLDLVIGVGSVAIAAAIPLGFLVIRRIVSPLEGLADVMAEYSQGKLDVRSPVRRRDEIGRLVEAFNRMADQHQQTHNGIVRLNAELESRVAKRTEQLRDLAAREPLTGLYNRRHFNEVLERSFSEAVRYDNDLSCIMIDLDQFKAVNDLFGHHVGDDLLVLTARTIASQLRTSDVAARFGGDEFVILLPQTDLERAKVLGERIFDKFAENAALSFPKVRTSMSIGIASLSVCRTSDADALARAADRAMYEAKAAGTSVVAATAEAASPAPTSSMS